jgi:hypothetical protein
MKITTAKLAELVAAGVKKNQPEIDKAVKAAVNAHKSTSRAVAKLHNAPAVTRSKAADAQARLMLTGPRMPVPTRQQIESVTQKNASDHESVLGAMRVARLQRAGKM